MSDRFDILDTPIAGLKVVQRRPVGDHRGLLERMFCSESLAALTSGASVAQINRTLTERRGTVRGLHFQMSPHAEIKFVSCLRGRIFDVAVDLRRGSATFLRWHSEVLSEDNHRTLVVPAGFAHGFQALTDGCELLYLHTYAYQPASERGLNARDPLLAINWPEDIVEMSARDASHALLTREFDGVTP